MFPILMFITSSTYKFERQHFRHGPRNEPRLGTHVRIDTLTLKKLKKLTHPTPGGLTGLLYVVRSFVPRQCWPRSGQNGTTARPRATDPARPRTTNHDHARPHTITHDRPRTHDCARPRTTDRARPRTTDRARPCTTTHDHARPRTTTHDYARPRMTDHARTTAHDRTRPRTTTHDRARPRMTDHARPRTTDHGCHICLRKRYPPHPQGGLGG